MSIKRQSGQILRELKKKGLSDITVKGYHSKLIDILKNTEDLKNINKVINFIDSKESSSTKKSYYIALFSYFKKKRVSKDIKETYKIQMNKYIFVN